MSPTADVGGTLALHPGRAVPNIESTRAAWARTLAPGRRALDLPDVLASVFRLCGDAHRLTARRAVAAAEGRDAAVAADDEVALQLDTLREHLRRLWLDWPGALAGAAPAGADLVALRDCPLLRPGTPAREALAATRPWLAAQVLGCSPHAWLAAWRDDPAGWLAAWSRQAPTLPARTLRACRDTAVALVAEPLPRVPADDAALAALAASLRADPGFALAPQWQGRCAETGPWARQADLTSGHARTAWLRLGARLAEAVRLAAPDVDGEAGARWLRQGGLRLADGEGLAWCEMARGLLVHRVRLRDAAGGPVVAECDVLAPTEWNFHPRGAVAGALAALPPHAGESTVRVLATAFDPCVSIRIARGAEAADA